MRDLKRAIIDSMVLAALSESRRYSSSTISKLLIIANVIALVVMYKSGSIKNAYMALNIAFAVVGIWQQIVHLHVQPTAIDAARRLDELIEEKEKEQLDT